jgi:DNA-binding GntR family transcriptional regulator
MKKGRNPAGYRSLKGIVYDFIIAALREGRLKPGDRIHEKVICDSLGVSRTPVREALLQLEPVGLVSFIPRQGIVVNDLTEEDVRELFETIAPLEAAAARLATPLLTNADFGDLERSLARMRHLIDAQDLPRLNQEMESFHDIPLSRCPNRLLVATIRLLKRRFYDAPRRIAFVPEWERQLLDEHRRLVGILGERDAESAAAFMQLHWSWEHNRPYALRSYFPRREEPPPDLGASRVLETGETSR